MGREGKLIEMRLETNIEYPEYWGESRKLYNGLSLPCYKAPYSVGSILRAWLSDELTIVFCFFFNSYMLSVFQDRRSSHQELVILIIVFTHYGND